MAKTFEDFLNYRNTTLSKIENKNGYHIFSNELAKAIYEVKPNNVHELSKIKGMPADGERCKKYGAKIIEFFNGSHTFS